VWRIVVVALGARQVENDFLGGIGGDFILDVDGAVAVENEVAGVSHDGGASRGDAVLGEKEEEAREELIHFGSGVEVGEIAEELSGERGIGIAAGRTEEMATAEAGLRVDGFGRATTTAGSAMDAAGRSWAEWWCCGRWVGRWYGRLIHSGIHFETSLSLNWAFVDFGERLHVIPWFLQRGGK
jgi:hypothetical protein